MDIWFLDDDGCKFMGRRREKENKLATHPSLSRLFFFFVFAFSLSSWKKIEIRKQEEEEEGVREPKEITS